MAGVGPLWVELGCQPLCWARPRSLRKRTSGDRRAMSQNAACGLKSELGPNLIPPSWKMDVTWRHSGQLGPLPVRNDPRLFANMHRTGRIQQDSPLCAGHEA